MDGHVTLPPRRGGSRGGEQRQALAGSSASAARRPRRRPRHRRRLGLGGARRPRRRPMTSSTSAVTASSAAADDVARPWPRPRPPRLSVRSQLPRWPPACLDLGGDRLDSRLCLVARPRPRASATSASARCSAASASDDLGLIELGGRDIEVRGSTAVVGDHRFGGLAPPGSSASAASCSAICWRTCAKAAARVLSMPPSGSWMACERS